MVTNKTKLTNQFNTWTIFNECYDDSLVNVHCALSSTKKMDMAINCNWKKSKKIGGWNRYKVPQINKDRLNTKGRLLYNCLAISMCLDLHKSD